jgi:hypothetical protein
VLSILSMHSLDYSDLYYRRGPGCKEKSGELPTWEVHNLAQLQRKSINFNMHFALLLSDIFIDVAHPHTVASPMPTCWNSASHVRRTIAPLTMCQDATNRSTNMGRLLQPQFIAPSYVLSCRSFAPLICRKLHLL